MSVQSNPFYTIPSKPVTQNQNRRLVRTKFELPEACNDTLMPYVMAVKQDSPIYSFCIGGMNFDRFVLPNEASLLGNESKHFPPKYIVRLLTEKQVEAIKKRAEEVVLVVPKRQNLKFSGKDGEQAYLDSQEIKASEIMVLMPVEKFNPLAFSMLNKEEIIKKEEVKPANKDDLYKVQRERK